MQGVGTMKRMIAYGLLLLLLCSVRVQAMSAQAAVLIDGDTGAVLYAHNKDARLPMASTTKIMTALVALGEGDLDRRYTVTKEYAGVEGSSMYLREGEELSIRDTLYGLLMVSGNDAATAIAGECGGYQAFIAKMNAKAQELGLNDTHFENPSGLPSDNHYTTAHELAKIAAAAMHDPLFRSIVATTDHTVGTHTLHNGNRMLQKYEDAIGVKTGFTKAAGRCLVSAAERNGRTLIAVTLNAPDDWNDHITMLEQGFAQYHMVTIHQAGDLIATQQVFGGEQPTVSLCAQNTVTAFLREGEREQLLPVRYGQQFCYAPIVQSADAGRVEYRLGDTVLARDGLRYQNAVLMLAEEKNWAERLLERFAG